MIRMLAAAFAVAVFATPARPALAQSTAAPALVLPTVHPEPAFEGTWINTNEQGGVIARVQVVRRGDTWFAHLWGNCPSCDWGEQPLRRANDSTDNGARLGLASEVWTRGIGAGRPGMTNVELVLAGQELELIYRADVVSASTPTRMSERFRSTEPDVHSAATAALNAERTAERGGVVAPRPIRRATPGYTGPAMRARIQGTVWVQGIVEIDGTLSDVRVVRSLDQQFGLDEEALNAARRWRFAPGTKDGQPVRVVVTIEIEFRIGTGPPRP